MEGEFQLTAAACLQNVTYLKALRIALNFWCKAQQVVSYVWRKMVARFVTDAPMLKKQAYEGCSCNKQHSIICPKCYLCKQYFRCLQYSTAVSL